MRILFALFAAFVSCAFGHGEAPFSAQVNKTTADYSIVCNGTADDTTTWGNFVSDNQGKNVVLTIPRGSVCCFLGSQANLSSGITNLRVIGYGATITNFCTTYGQPYNLGGDGIVQDNTHSSLTATVVAGATFVTLLTPAETSRFSAGSRGMESGGDLQGTGFPPNPWNHDYVTITGVDGACHGTGTVCFSSPLKNPYKSTWPSYNTVNLFRGGPATLYALPSSWGGSVEWRGITFTLKDPTAPHNDIGINCRGLMCRFDGVTFTGTGNACTQPSEVSLFTFQNVSGPGCGIEADKIVDLFLVQGSTLSEIDFSSAASITQLVLNTTPLTHIACTPLTSVLANSTITTIQKGGCGYGPALWTVLNGMSWTTLQDVTTGQTNVDSAFTMSGGVMSQALPNCDPPLSCTTPLWAVPGMPYLFSDGVHSDVPFTVVDLAASGGNLQIITSLSGGYPFTPLNVKSIPIPTTINP